VWLGICEAIPPFPNRAHRATIKRAGVKLKPIPEHKFKFLLQFKKRDRVPTNGMYSSSTKATPLRPILSNPYMVVPACVYVYACEDGRERSFICQIHGPSLHPPRGVP